ncbi:GntR family transcriptional regulator [Lacticaseibacillus jixianensis]|uniref:GntR family transcriptional regulator n=1 Tax=Lacticaseibacillus jixianensis TaxID=2486012 RepID=A0ABW4BAY4_9LACO|nr:GntR family transcriptional regulator [Lacticaseibacillus jixianensis]
MKTKYQLIADALRQKITNHEYDVGDQLPQEEALGKAYNASRITVRRALDELQSAGLINRVQGAGTFVKNDRELEEEQGSFDLIDPATISIDVLDFAVTKPSASIKKRLAVNDYDFVYEIKRRYMFEGRAIGFNHIWMPVKLIQGMRLDVLKGSIYDFLQSDLDLALESSKRSFKVARADDEVAKALAVDAGTPLLEVVQESYLSQGRKFEYGKTEIVTSRYTLQETMI